MTDAEYAALVPGDTVVVCCKIDLLDDRDWRVGTVITVARKRVDPTRVDWFFNSPRDVMPLWLRAPEVCTLDRWAAQTLLT